MIKGVNSSMEALMLVNGKHYMNKTPLKPHWPTVEERLNRKMQSGRLNK
jgi:hypothetical protein